MLTMRLLTLILPILLFCSAWPAFAQTQENLQSLEAQALQYLNEDNPERALELYQQYEYLMPKEGWSFLQPDLLNNQAVAHYRAGNLGEAMAYLKQLYILEHTPEIEEKIQELQRLIEHRVYQHAPNTAFVRGQSNKYITWETAHRFSKMELSITGFILWTLFFLSIGIFFIVRRLKKSKPVLITFISVWCILIAGTSMFYLQYRQTDDMAFGVLKQTQSLRQNPGYDAPHIQDPAFVPGMTVAIIASVEGWIKIRRMDGVSCWVDIHDLYLLRGIDEECSAHLH